MDTARSESDAGTLFAGRATAAMDGALSPRLDDDYRRRATPLPRIFRTAFSSH